MSVINWRERERESASVFSPPDRAPVSGDEQMVDLAATWVVQAHPQEAADTTALLSLNVSLLTPNPLNLSLSLSAH